MTSRKKPANSINNPRYIVENTQSTKQLSRDQTRSLQRRVTHNNTSANNRLHTAKRLTQPKRPVRKIVNNSREARHLASTQRVNVKR